MLNYPYWVQFLIVLVVADIIPVSLLVIIGKSKCFPVFLRTPLLFVGIVVMDRLTKVMPVETKVKDAADYVYILLGAIFVIIMFKFKWFWDDEVSSNNDE